MKKAALHNLGCKVNGYETEVMQQILAENGYEIVDFDEFADIYIVNTCTVTGIADKKSRQMLHRAKRQNPDAVVIAAGCYVQTGKEAALKDEGIDLMIGNNKKGELLSILEKFFKRQEQKGKDEAESKKTLDGSTVLDIGQAKEYESMLLKEAAEHTRAFMKIQDGCNQFCSYCIIPYARGRIRSRQEAEILEEAKTLAKNGYKEVVLTGIHISSYDLWFEGIANPPAGEDYPHKRLLQLIKKIHEIDGIERIRLGSLEPRIITEAFIKELSGMKKVCPHFHLSLQSGSDSVLKQMNRKYTSGEYYDKVCILRNYFENPAITTDIITGFPGETEEEFEKTRAFLEKTEFYEMHIFKYSRRQGTPAASMKGQIPEAVKAERSDILLELNRKMSHKYRERHLHKEMTILFEEEKKIGDKIYQTGHSMEYIQAAVPAGENLSGRILKGSCESFLDSEILLFSPAESVKFE